MSTSANKESSELIEGDTAMGEALRELMRKELENSKNSGFEQGMGIVLEALVKDGSISIERANEIRRTLVKPEGDITSDS